MREIHINLIYQVQRTRHSAKGFEYEAVLGETKRNALKPRRSFPFTSWTEQGCIARVIAVGFPFVLGMTPGC